MLYNWLLPYIHSSHLANLFHYISFRSGLAILLNLLLFFVFGPFCIRKLKSWQKFGRTIRDYVPETHHVKAGTPTMGGLLIIGSVTLSVLLLSDLRNIYIQVTLFVMISVAILGFVDDYIKVINNNNKGLSGTTKLIIQAIISIIACLIVNHYAVLSTANHLVVPFFKHLTIDLGVYYIAFAMFVIIGASNAVNLTDGLDGLAIVPIAIVSLCLGVICYLSGNIIHSEYLQILYISQVSELTVLCAAIIGASLGFLWYNAMPAEIFMGDTGSLSLGSTLGIISVISKNEIILSIIGGLFVIETVSVIIQVYYFKVTGGKRIFKMAPLHHHFEKIGWSEPKIVIRLWILSIILALIGLSSLKLR